MKRNSRTSSDIRKPRVVPDFTTGAWGSLLFEMGNTRIICAASCDTLVPEHAAKKGSGWLTAEYTMLPYSTNPRTKRELIKKDGRSVEIQRLIGRSLRQAVDLSLMEGVSITVDCDVVSADGGTRTAAITGGFIALKFAVRRLLAEGLLKQDPIVANVAAISVGIIDDELLLDLDYSEDSRADVDMNIVMDSNRKLIEIQGTAEGAPFSIERMNEMVHLAFSGIEELIGLQNSL